LQLDELDEKILAANLSSPTCIRYKIVKDTTKEFLMQGILHENEIKRSRESAVAKHKSKLFARMSIQKGGSILASDALAQKKAKIRKAAEENVRKAQAAINKAKSKARRDLNDQGKADRRAKKARVGLYSAWNHVRDHHNAGDPAVSV
jgi:predicted KAP-like P-loop ATPase